VGAVCGDGFVLLAVFGVLPVAHLVRWGALHDRVQEVPHEVLDHTSDFSVGVDVLQGYRGILIDRRVWEHVVFLGCLLRRGSGVACIKNIFG